MEGFQIFKQEIKEYSKSENSLKSISFSNFNEEIIVYFAWNNTSSSLERYTFREMIKRIVQKYDFIFYKSKSTSSKFVFLPREIVEDYFSKNV